MSDVVSLEEARIQHATGCPARNIAVTWPAVIASLQAEGIDHPLVRAAAVATIATETPAFLPLSEIGGGTRYEGRQDLGNTEPGDGDRYKGRGLIQITGRHNYRRYGYLIGRGDDLVRNPDLANEPMTAARILAVYFRRRGVATAACLADWPAVRRKVNGGYNGWARFKAVIERFLGEPVQDPPELRPGAA